MGKTYLNIPLCEFLPMPEGPHLREQIPEVLIELDDCKDVEGFEYDVIGDNVFIYYNNEENSMERRSL